MRRSKVRIRDPIPRMFLHGWIILRLLFVSRISAAPRSPAAPRVTSVPLLFWTNIGFSSAKARELERTWSARRHTAEISPAESSVVPAPGCWLLGVTGAGGDCWTRR